MDVQESFDITIQSASLRDAGIDVLESSLDSLIDNEVIKQIPIVKIFVGAIQAGIHIQDKLFLKKVLAFLQGIDEVPEKDRKKIIERIDKSDKYRVKVGEKLLFVLDSCDDHTHAENVAKLFLAMLRNEISYSQYIDTAQIMARLSRGDLDQFVDCYNDPNFLDDSAASLSHTGLVYIETEEIEVEIEKVEQANWKDPPEHYEAKTYGGGTTVKATTAGSTVFEVFGIGKEKLELQIKERSKQQKEMRRKNIEPAIQGVRK